MSYSPTTTIASEILSDGSLSEGTLSYLESRAKNVFYSFILNKFKEAEKEGFTKSKLAKRIRKKPDQISHILGSPGNWTIATIAVLLAGICKEEFIPNSKSFLNRPPRNMHPEDFLEMPAWKPLPTSETNVSKPPKWRPL